MNPLLTYTSFGQARIEILTDQSTSEDSSR